MKILTGFPFDPLGGDIVTNGSGQGFPAPG